MDDTEQLIDDSKSITTDDPTEVSQPLDNELHNVSRTISKPGPSGNVDSEIPMAEMKETDVTFDEPDLTETLVKRENYGTFDEHESMRQSLDRELNYESRGWCMVCREEITIKVFEDLKPGDHIATAGDSCCGCLYDHHAIVTNIEITKVVNNDVTVSDIATGRNGANDNTTDNGNNQGKTTDTAVITVVDVDSKGCSREKCFGRWMPCCCCYDVKCCCCCKCKYEIKEHSLFDKTWSLPKTSNIFKVILVMVCTFFIKLYKCICCKKETTITQNIKRISYRNRRNNYLNTKEMALRFVQSDGNQNNLEYCLFAQNCEHFASACVNDKTTMTFGGLRDSMSLQTRNCCWRFMHILFLFIQGTFYALNFCIYAVFVEKDDSFNIFGKSIENFLERNCYHPKNIVPGFNTTCDWFIFAVFFGVLILLFIIVLSMCYQPLYKKGYICRQCVIVACLDCLTKLITFLIIEVVSIYLEKISYQHSTRWHAGKFAIFVVFGISVCGAVLVYSISSWLTWLIGISCAMTCKEANTFTRYFKFRGLVVPFFLFLGYFVSPFLILAYYFALFLWCLLYPFIVLVNIVAYPFRNFIRKKKYNRSQQQTQLQNC